MADDIVRVEYEADPERCQGMAAHGQCMNKRVPGTEKCKYHQAQLIKNQQARNFRLTKWQQRVNEFADNDQAKSLREEIGILRMVLEETLQKCESSVDLVLQANKISTLVSQIEKLVVSCHKLEQSTNYLMNTDQILRFADSFLQLLENCGVNDAQLLDQMSQQVPLLIENIGARRHEPSSQGTSGTTS